MGTNIESLYQQLFSEQFFVCEEESPYFQELIVQIIWNEQLIKGPLYTECGEIIEILHPGMWNVESGPDFHDATIIMNKRKISGAVEIHTRPEDWMHHNHQLDENYDHVILHAVWENPAEHINFPEDKKLLVLKKYFTGSLQKIIENVSEHGYPYAQKVAPGDYAELMQKLSDSKISDMLQLYGLSRLMNKSKTHGEQIIKHGLNESAYRCFYETLGYKNNREQFLQLCDSLPLASSSNLSVDQFRALSFGAAGFLPDPSKIQILPHYNTKVSAMWSFWWKNRIGDDAIEWNRQKLRPFNFPERRLLAGMLVMEKNNFSLGDNLLAIFHDHTDPKQIKKELIELFTLEGNNWDGFLSFEKSLSKPVRLLGESRINDIIVNFALPFALAWSFMQKSVDINLCRKIKDIYLQYPMLQKNRLQDEAIHRLFVPPSRSKNIVKNAAAQQGLLMIYKKLLQ
ncbi:MAG: DUF2851 family protein [Lentisphaeria bacterium]|nr:DUF2851 family protein [Lentisphaeria bacterium]NQZ67587.1 DUF2851 family protein [Lentisphaeria bacterium]